MRRLAHRALQGHATRLRGVGAAHRQAVRIELFGQLRRHLAAEEGFRLGMAEQARILGRRYRPFEKRGFRFRTHALPVSLTLED